MLRVYYKVMLGNRTTMLIVQKKLNIELDRFARGYADFDRREREQQHQRKMQSIDYRRRVGLQK
jgi:hypothetical protein